MAVSRDKFTKNNKVNNNSTCLRHKGKICYYGNQLLFILTPPDRSHTYIGTDKGPTLQQQVKC